MKLFIALFLILVALFLPRNAFAQTHSTSSGQAYSPSAIPSTVSPTSPIYTDLLVHNMFHTFSCLAVGQSVIGQPCLTYQLTQNAQGMIQGIPVLSQANLSGGTLGAVTGLIGGLYQNPPVRTYESLASLGQTLGLVKEARAQVVGSGAGVLQPIQTLWQVSRNISYVIMIIIFVIIGLMVMFRQRINPQTVITAQAAIPGLVIGLILITFSYFLAGLISDTAFIGTNLVGAYFSAVQNKPPQNLVQDISAESVLTLMGRLINGIDRDSIANGVGIFFNTLVDPASRIVRTGAAVAAYQIGSFIGPAIGVALALAICGPPALGLTFIPGVNVAGWLGFTACVGGANALGPAAGGAVVAGLTAQNPPAYIGLGLWILAIVIIIYAMFKLLMRLINSFLTIIFLVITAPFHFLIAALPGRQGLATNWILNLLANVLAFPAVLAVFYFVAFILGQSFGPLTVSELNGMKDNSVISPVYAQDRIGLVNSATFPLFGGLDLGFIRILLAFGALVATPAIPDIIARSIGRVSQAGQLIGQEISAGTAGGRRYLDQTQGGLGKGAGDISRVGVLGPSSEISMTPEGPAVVTRPSIFGRITGAIPTYRPIPRRRP